MSGANELYIEVIRLGIAWRTHGEDINRKLQNARAAYLARGGERWCTAGGAELAIKLGECLRNVNEGKL